MFSAMSKSSRLKRRPWKRCFENKKVEPILYSLSGFQLMLISNGKRRESWPTKIVRDSMSMQCNSSKNLKNDGMVLTVSLVIGKIEPSAKKGVA